MKKRIHLLLAILPFGTFAESSVPVKRKITDVSLYYSSKTDVSPEDEDTTDGFGIIPDFGIEIIPPSIKTPCGKFYTQKNFVREYFKNLDNNIIENLDGICGYTAIGMLLSFYDNYWYNGIIPDKHEAVCYLDSLNDNEYSSPGIKDNIASFRRLTDVINSSASEDNIADDIRSHTQDIIDSGSFLGELFDIALTEGFLEGDITDWGVSFELVDTVLRKYVSNHQIAFKGASVVSNNFELAVDKDTSKYIESREVIRDEIIYYLKQDIPLIVGGTNVQGGHVCIAYEYDEDNDIIYGNLGWKGGTFILNECDEDRWPTHTTRVEENCHASLDEFFSGKGLADSGFSDYYGLVYDDEVAYHLHSNNYICNNKTYCSCKLGIHEHFYIYKCIDASYHSEECICYSDPVNKTHVFSSSYFNGGKEYAECGYCHYAYPISSGGPIVGYM